MIEARVLRPVVWRHVGLRRAAGLSDGEILKTLGLSADPVEAMAQFHELARFRFFFHPRNRKDFFFQLLTAVQDQQSILEEADDVLENRFEALGSGKVDLGPQINWQRDFRSGAEWPLMPSRELDVLDLGRASDVKVPWELSRFHQVWWLGKAYWLTGNEAYARKFATLIDDWIDRNPIGLGVHWVLAMEPAIRACNWIAGYYFFCESSSIAPAFWVKFLRSLTLHGQFIRNNLEFARTNRNHYLSNIVGLMFLGIFLRDLGVGRRWLNFSLKALEEQMQQQVYPDGVDFEQSVSYHHLVLEFFATSALLCRNNRLPLSDAFWNRLKKMFEFVMHYSRPDGSVPLVGDADDGRLFRFTRSDPMNDHRPILAVGAILFKRSDFRKSASRFSQHALWLAGTEGFEKFESIPSEAPPLRTAGFTHGGFYIFHGRESHVFIDAGQVGMDKRAGHGHNDVLSFEFWGNGSSFIVDSGTYTYTADAAARQELRSTRAHNTAMVNGKEQADFRGLWGIEEDRTNTSVLEWKVTDSADLLEAEHSAYRRFVPPVVHRRRFQFDKRKSVLTIDDTFAGAADTPVEITFHLHPLISIEMLGKNRYLLKSERAVMEFHASHPATVQEGWFSPGYGIRTRNKVLCLAFTASPDLKISTRLSISQ